MAASYHSPCWLIISCVAVVIRDHCETSQRGWQTDKHFPHLKTTNNIHHISWKSNVWSKYELLKFYSRPNEISREKRSNFPLRSNKTIWPNLTIVKMWTLGLAEEETFQDSIIWMAWRWYCSKKGPQRLKEGWNTIFFSVVFSIACCFHALICSISLLITRWPV